MGLFDSIAGQVSGALSNATGSGKPDMMEAISGLISPESGGLQGLVTTFRKKGLGNIVASWISTGQNLPISSEQVQAIAQKLGLSSTDASNALANLLPQVVDKLTPNGQLFEGNLVEQGLVRLKGFSGKA